ncbi:MAG TPA: LysR substrate-binding domain-containing protein [Burkholderiaceae bacterium]|nr:LysR substrate-binding domain-containing protein [Burkholderiaceae bacterium]
MTLTELKYIVAVARERHFGRAADACFVTQPTLSIAIRKLEDELGLPIFERRATDVTPTPIGERIVAQADRVLSEAGRIRDIALEGKDPLVGPLRLGMIYTVGPYLLPSLVRELRRATPRMPLLLNENFTLRLVEMLKNGEIDIAIMAEPVPDASLMVQPLYDEPFVVAVPRDHAWARRKAIDAAELKGEHMLLLGSGHCFRDQVIEFCPEAGRVASSSDAGQRAFEGSSLETIRHMVASGLGVTVLPITSVPGARGQHGSLIHVVPFRAPPPGRRVVAVWRRSYTRLAAIEALCHAVRKCPLDGVEKIPPPSALAA